MTKLKHGKRLLRDSRRAQNTPRSASVDHQSQRAHLRLPPRAPQFQCLRRRPRKPLPRLSRGRLEPLQSKPACPPIAVHIEALTNTRTNPLRQELFSKLRFSYLEQVTKEKFLRSIVGDPPLIVEPAENSELDGQLADVKAVLTEQKAAVARMVQELEARGRDLSRRE